MMNKTSIAEYLCIITALIMVLSALPLLTVYAMSAGEQGQAKGVAEHIMAGQEAFGRNCQICHNSRGIGGKCPPLIHGAWAPDGPNSDEIMYQIISKGRPNTQMGAFEHSLSDEEIWNIIHYLRYEARRYADEQKNAPQDEDDLLRR